MDFQFKIDLQKKAIKAENLGSSLDELIHRATKNWTKSHYSALDEGSEAYYSSSEDYQKWIGVLEAILQTSEFNYVDNDK